MRRNSCSGNHVSLPITMAMDLDVDSNFIQVRIASFQWSDAALFCCKFGVIDISDAEAEAGSRSVGSGYFL